MAKAPKSAPSTAASKSASSKTMLGFLPPSSMVVRLIVFAALAITMRPVSTPPVKAILSTRGSSTSVPPATGPSPVTMFTAPAGTPASARISARISADSGDCSAGLRIAVQPAARAGPSFHAAMSSG